MKIRHRTGKRPHVLRQRKTDFFCSIGTVAELYTRSYLEKTNPPVDHCEKSGFQVWVQVHRRYCLLSNIDNSSGRTGLSQYDLVEAPL